MSEELNNFKQIAIDWGRHQTAYIFDVYKTFRDHNKFLILIYLLKKTFDEYKKNSINVSYADFYLKNHVEINKFSIIDLSNKLLLPKETARRKVLELEKIGAIKRIKKKIILDRSVFPNIKPEKSIIRISMFLNKFYDFLNSHKAINKKISSKNIQNHFMKNFTTCWNFYYILQIGIMTTQKKTFEDIESWHLWGICYVNKFYVLKNNNTKNSINIFEKSIAKMTGPGLNAMTISEMSGIPRATVVRKLNILLKKKILVVDEKKQYHPGKKFNEIKETNRNIIDLLAKFTTSVYNDMLIS